MHVRATRTHAVATRAHATEVRVNISIARKPDGWLAFVIRCLLCARKDGSLYANIGKEMDWDRGLAEGAVGNRGKKEKQLHETR